MMLLSELSTEEFVQRVTEFILEDEVILSPGRTRDTSSGMGPGCQQGAGCSLSCGWHISGQLTLSFPQPDPEDESASGAAAAASDPEDLPFSAAGASAGAHEHRRGQRVRARESFLGVS